MTPRRLRTVIAANIKRYAAKRGMTISVLADTAGVATGALYRVLKTDSSVTADTLAKVAEALDVHPARLLDE